MKRDAEKWRLAALTLLCDFFYASSNHLSSFFASRFPSIYYSPAREVSINSLSRESNTYTGQ